MESEILEKIKFIKETDLRKSMMTVSDKLVKLQEEVGEVASAHMRELGFKSLKKYSPEGVRMNKKEEYADVLVVLLDLILSDGFTFDEIKEELEINLNKRINKINGI